MKNALNLTLDLGCETKFIDMVNGFIDRKKNDIDDANDKNKENLNVSDPLVRKWRGHLPNKRIKSALENNLHIGTKNSALNPPNPNLYVFSSKNPLHISNNE